MGKLYIFGNGLDLHYGLKTSTDDFVSILRKKSVYNEIENAVDVFAQYNVLWSDFELDIANLDLNQIEESQVAYPDYMSDHEYDRDGVITNVEDYVNSLRNAIFDSLEEMASNAEDDINNLSHDYQWRFDQGDMILSFNYTSTIESVSDTKDIPILHIHGFYNNSEQLILGYKDAKDSYNYEKYSNPDDGDYYMEKQLEIIHDFYLSMKKELQFKRLEDFLKNVNGIDEVIMYGHSLGTVDIPYLEYIESTLHPSHWKVSYYKSDDDVEFNMKRLSFASKIETFEW